MRPFEYPQEWPTACSRFPTPSLAIALPSLLLLSGLSGAGVAQLVEHLICNQRVGGSIPSASSTRFQQGSEAERFPVCYPEWAGVSGHESVLCFRSLHSKRQTMRLLLGTHLVSKGFFADTNFVSRMSLPGRVGEWLKPADCKSAAPCGLRRFESFPVHHCTELAR